MIGHYPPTHWGRLLIAFRRLIGEDKVQPAELAVAFGIPLKWSIGSLRRNSKIGCHQMRFAADAK
jgi:hypothetical protein